MLGHHIDGGLATHIVVPERNAVPLPDDIPFEHGAIMMCSSATSLHALRKSRFTAGETVAVFGCGGLGMSAIQVAHALGALEVFAIDIDVSKLSVAESFGAIPIDASTVDPVEEIRRRTNDSGVNVSLELAGRPVTVRQSIECLGVFGRSVIAGINESPVEMNTYQHLIGKECEVIGSNDHLLTEIYLLLELTKRGKIDLSSIVSKTIPLDAGQINKTLSQLETFSSPIRTVVSQ
jgi:propanol-preferring alcohol dehydrogenase